MHILKEITDSKEESPPTDFLKFICYAEEVFIIEGLQTGTRRTTIQNIHTELERLCKSSAPFSRRCLDTHHTLITQNNPGHFCLETIMERHS